MTRGLTVDAKECTVFAMAWLRATDDPTVGTGQDSNTFQSKVNVTYFILYNTKPISFRIIQNLFHFV